MSQFRAFAAHRSAYQSKEADPHSWARPRLWGEPKAALVHLQAEEWATACSETCTRRLSPGP